MIRKILKQWSQVVLWPAKLINTRIRLSIALSCSVLTITLVAQLLQLLPDETKSTMEARQRQTQTLAMAGTTMFESPKRLKEFHQLLKYSVQADPKLLSAGLRNQKGKLLIEVGEHEINWHTPENGKSNDQFMFIPAYAKNESMGQIELRFQPLGDIPALLHSPIATLAVFMMLSSFASFNLILYRTLKQLDPRGAVPRRVREAFDHMAEGLLIIDRNGSIMMANSKFGALVGIQPEKLTTLNCSDFQWLEVEELPWQKAVRLQQSVSNLTLQIVDREETLRTFSVSAAPVFGNNNTCRGVMVTFDDITSLEEHKLELIKARKAADAANQAKSNFLSRMSHEIRTPMNAIIGYADILREGVQNQEDQNQYLSTIHASGEHLLTLINDILDLSKIEAGQMTIEKRTFSIAPLLAQVINTLKLKTDQKNLSLDLRIEGKIPATITNDETRLRQVLINIIGNSVKFTKEGGVVVVAKMAESNQLLEFDIVDSGVGIAPDAQAAIFKPFSQADCSVTRKFGGTGLGLTICKELSESMGGSIGVQSKEGVGTVFTFSIDPGDLTDVPRISQGDIKLQSQTNTTNQPKSKFEPRHILVVDDVQANRQLAGLILSRLGLTYEEAENGRQAVDLITSKSFDVVLMDISMPVMDGLTATGLIREQGIDVPIVALTAMAVKEEEDRCLAGGCTSFLPKPIRNNKLIPILSQFIPLARSAPTVERIQESTVKLETSSKPDARGVQETIAKPSPCVDQEARSNQVTIEKQKTNRDHEARSKLEAIAKLKSRADQEARSKLATIAKLKSRADVEACRDRQTNSIPNESAEQEPRVRQETTAVVDTSQQPDRSNHSTLPLPDVVRSTLEMDEEMLTIISDYTIRMRQRLGEFWAAWESKNLDALRDHAHWLAGSSGTVGFQEFVAPARELQYSDCSDAARVEELLNYIGKLADRIQVADVSSVS